MGAQGPIAILLTVCQQVVQAVGESLERISVAMGFRACYHSSRAVQRGESHELVPFVGEQAKFLGLVTR